MSEKNDRDDLSIKLDELAVEMLQGVEIDMNGKREFAALSQIAIAAIISAHRAVSKCDMIGSKLKDQLILELTIEFMRLAVRRTDEPPQIVMMPAQGRGIGPFGNIPGIS
jgi:hypothetical protein